MPGLSLVRPISVTRKRKGLFGERTLIYKKIPTPLDVEHPMGMGINIS
jgi:hypothetical protein